MKASLPLFKTCALAVPLALLLQAGAQAQTKQESSPSTAAGAHVGSGPLTVNKDSAPTAAGRQAIVTKLDRIRFDKVDFPGLPLSEVVNYLVEETRLRDPEKKGLNFIMVSGLGPQPAQTTTGQPVPPPPQPEQYALGEVQIKIEPPLRDVRLADVLDAIVAVADHPIQYSIQDYAVVFAKAGPTPEREPGATFTFAGGTPQQFLEALQKQEKVDWSNIAHIPGTMQNARIPALRLNPESLEPILRPEGPGTRSGGGGGSGSQATMLQALIALYNRLGEVSPELGKLVVEGDLTKPSVVMFVGGVKATVPELKVKAFPLKGISEKAWPSLQEDIARASDIARSRMDAYYDHQHVPRDFNATVLFQGDVRINRNTSLLVATGSETYVEMVESTVTAYQANQRAGLGGSAPTPAK